VQVVVNSFLEVALGLIVWSLLYMNARCAYRVPGSLMKTTTELALVCGAAGAFVLQVLLMNKMLPDDSRRGHFFIFVLIECGGGIAITLITLLVERSKSIVRP